MPENKEYNLSVQLAIQSAITNCVAIPDYYQAIMLDSNYSGFNLRGLKDYIIDNYNYYNLDMCLWNPNYMTLTNRRDRSTIDVYDLSAYDRDTAKGRRFHNIICLCPISEKVYTKFITTITVYKNPVKTVLEDREVSW